MKKSIENTIAGVITFAAAIASPFYINYLNKAPAQNRSPTIIYSPQMENYQENSERHSESEIVTTTE